MRNEWGLAYRDHRRAASEVRHEERARENVGCMGSGVEEGVRVVRDESFAYGTFRGEERVSALLGAMI